jgi:hypothetical protein
VSVLDPPRRGSYDDSPVTDPKLSPAFRILLWDFERSSLAYDLALVAVVLLLLLVPGDRWGDPFWR